MRILFITPYPPNQAPSQRFRFEQYLNFLSGKGIHLEQVSFLDNDAWGRFYQQNGIFFKVIDVIKGIFKRLMLTFRIKSFDIIFIHREACFIGPAFFEWLYSRFNKKIIFDFDDAIWLHDVSDANEKLGWLKHPSKTAHIIAYSAHVIAGNSYLASYARKFNPNVTVIPTTIDTEYHKPIAVQKSKETITIGWTGTITTGKHFEMLVPVLKKLKNKYEGKVRILLISNKAPVLDDLEIDFIPWKKETEIEDLCKIDIGIMPLPDDMWAKGKCGFKGLQYMSLEIPTIMSPVGVNTEIIEDGNNGFLASTEEEWIEKLSLLIENPELRVKIGKAGRQTVIERYSVESQKERYLEVFKSIT
jgi:glycosyltransferase involved in cell wall biosynthesis